jgi:hypothetical protein
MTCERCVLLKHDPLAVFQKSRPPGGFYDRSRWLAYVHDSAWQIDCERKIAALRKGQLRNGSWEDFPLLTAGRIFDSS